MALGSLMMAWFAAANGLVVQPKPQARVLTDKFAEGQFPRTWVPIASTFELIPDRPTPVQFLEQRVSAGLDPPSDCDLSPRSISHPPAIVTPCTLAD